MAYTLGEAAKATGLTRPSILKAIQTNRLYAKKDDLNRWQIEPQDLFAIYPKKDEEKQEKKQQENTNDVSALHVKLHFLQEEKKLLETYIDDLKKDRDSLRDMFERERAHSMHQTAITARALEMAQEARRALAILQQETPTSPPPVFSQPEPPQPPATEAPTDEKFWRGAKVVMPNGAFAASAKQSQRRWWWPFGRQR